MKKTRILIAEDDAIIAFLLGETLKDMGHEVCAIVGSEDEAIAAALRSQPDLMIVDEHLGEGSGVGVVEALSKHGPVAHVFVSGDALKIKKLRPGSVTIEKPYFEADLAWAIRTALFKALGTGAPGSPVATQSPTPFEDRARPNTSSTLN
jgi:CheY-like chemotaxis protein